MKGTHQILLGRILCKGHPPSPQQIKLKALGERPKPIASPQENMDSNFEFIKINSLKLTNTSTPIFVDDCTILVNLRT